MTTLSFLTLIVVNHEFSTSKLNLTSCPALTVVTVDVVTGLEEVPPPPPLELLAAAAAAAAGPTPNIPSPNLPAPITAAYAGKTNKRKITNINANLLYFICKLPSLSIPQFN